MSLRRADTLPNMGAMPVAAVAANSARFQHVINAGYERHLQQKESVDRTPTPHGDMHLDDAEDIDAPAWWDKGKAQAQRWGSEMYQGAKERAARVAGSRVRAKANEAAVLQSRIRQLTKQSEDDPSYAAANKILIDALTARFLLIAGGEIQA